MAIQARILQAQVDTFQQKDLVVDQMGLLLFPEHKNSTLLNRYTQFILMKRIIRNCFIPKLFGTQR